MEKIYAELILKGKKRVEDVPDFLKAKVEGILNELVKSSIDQSDQDGSTDSGRDDRGDLTTL